MDDLLIQMNLEEKANQLATYYGYKTVLEDSLPTKEWKTSMLRHGIANIDEHLKMTVYDLERMALSITETQRFLWNILVWEFLSILLVRELEDCVLIKLLVFLQ